MSQLMSSVTRQDRPDPADPHVGHWYRLQEERRFRVEQLAALDAELAANQQHDCLKLALRIAAITALDEIDAALARMADGRYGLCVNCAQPLPAARLEVLPRAPLCMQCHFNEQNCHLAPRPGGPAQRQRASLGRSACVTSRRADPSPYSRQGLTCVRGTVRPHASTQAFQRRVKPGPGRAHAGSGGSSSLAVFPSLASVGVKGRAETHLIVRSMSAARGDDRRADRG